MTNHVGQQGLAKKKKRLVIRAAVLVEGLSDKLALEALARKRGRDLESEGVTIEAMGGSKNIAGFLDRFGPQGVDATLSGLCDAGEEEDFRRVLERAGFGLDLTREDMERLGFFVCVADLEDELIRALGAPTVLQVIDALGDMDKFHTFQKQPEWRARTIEDQLHRFFGVGSGRKTLAAPMLVDALDLARVPRPLDGVLAHV
jgi:hypothetical protein